jgi:hypothetical protein
MSNLSPPPGERRRDDGSMPLPTSLSALVTVLRVRPEVFATTLQHLDCGTRNNSALQLVHARKHYLEESSETLFGDFHIIRILCSI